VKNKDPRRRSDKKELMVELYITEQGELVVTNLTRETEGVFMGLAALPDNPARFYCG
jgi:hypothetical protein